MTATNHIVDVGLPRAHRGHGRCALDAAQAQQRQDRPAEQPECVRELLLEYWRSRAEATLVQDGISITRTASGLLGAAVELLRLEWSDLLAKHPRLPLVLRGEGLEPRGLTQRHRYP